MLSYYSDRTFFYALYAGTRSSGFIDIRIGLRCPSWFVFGEFHLRIVVHSIRS